MLPLPNQTDMVRIALEELGKDAMPLAISKYIKDRWDVEIERKTCGSLKSQILGGKLRKDRTLGAPKEALLVAEELLRLSGGSFEEAHEFLRILKRIKGV